MDLTTSSQVRSAPTLPKNAYFISLAVNDLGCFEGSQNIELASPQGLPHRWTLILGENGVGKTTLLQLLSLGAAQDVFGPGWPQSKEPRYAPALVEVRDRLPLIRLGKDRFDVSYVIAWSESLKDPGQRDESRLLGEQKSLQFSTFSFGGPSIVYGYGANRRRSPPGLTAERSDSTSRTLFDDDSTLRNPEEWLLQNELVARTDSPLQPSAQRQNARVRDILTRVLPGVRDLRLSPHSDGAKELRAIVEVQSHDGWVPFSSLGLGYRTMTAWIVDFASRLFERYSDLVDPLSGPAVCLVDEIDLHLHPLWQRELVGHLTNVFPNTQFIATSHSPLIVQSTSDANIVVLRRKPDGVCIDNSPQNIQRWRLDQILTSDLFELPSSRPRDLDARLSERDELLSREVLTESDKRRLNELRQEIGALPLGETAEDIEAADLIRRAASFLRRTER